MNRQDLRERARPAWEDICNILDLDHTKCNQDCLVIPEDLARAGKVFDFSVEIQFPTVEEWETAILEAENNIKKHLIREKYSNILKKVVEPYSKEERETWERQERQARLYLTNPTATVPFISKQAEKRGKSVSDLVDLIMENVVEYEETCGEILGLQQKELDELT